MMIKVIRTTTSTFEGAILPQCEVAAPLLTPNDARKEKTERQNGR